MRVVVIAIVVLSACGTSTRSCPADEPATCPGSGSPSYATDVAPIFDKYCVSACHGPGGVEAAQPLSTYAEIQKLGIDNVNVQVYDCLMPMAPPDPTTAERVTLLTWIVCGAPDN